MRAKTEIEQELWSQSCRLIANAVIYYNALILSRNLNLSDKNTQDLLRNSSPIAWKHINFYGSYEFYKKKLTDKDILTPSVLSKEMFE